MLCYTSYMKKQKTIIELLTVYRVVIGGAKDDAPSTAYRFARKQTPKPYMPPKAQPQKAITDFGAFISSLE